MRFLLDVMLGSLATHLRFCGHDAAYALDRGVEADDALLALAAEEERVLVTRDRDLAARADTSLPVTSLDVEDQLRELSRAGVALDLPAEPTRCGRCNGRLAPVGDGETPAYAPDPREREVWRCRDCGQHFWRGSHWERVAKTLAGVRDDRREED